MVRQVLYERALQRDGKGMGGRKDSVRARHLLILRNPPPATYYGWMGFRQGRQQTDKKGGSWGGAL